MLWYSHSYFRSGLEITSALLPCKLHGLPNFQSFSVFVPCPWSTKYTALYVTFWRPKLRGQFSENLVLSIYKFLFNFGDRISEEKKLWKILKKWHKYGKNFQLTYCFLINTLLFVRIEQKSKTEARKQPFKCVP